MRHQPGSLKYTAKISKYLLIDTAKISKYLLIDTAKISNYFIWMKERYL